MGGEVVGEIRMREIVQPCKQCRAETLQLARELQKGLTPCTLLWRLASVHTGLGVLMRAITRTLDTQPHAHCIAQRQPVQPGSFARGRRFCQGCQEWCTHVHSKNQGGRWHAQHGSTATCRVLQRMHATHVCWIASCCGRSTPAAVLAETCAQRRATPVATVARRRGTDGIC